MASIGLILQHGRSQSQPIVDAFDARVIAAGGTVEGEACANSAISKLLGTPLEDGGTAYSEASLLNIPSGYEAGTLFSQKPTDGAGDFTFTRVGDTATRVNSAGLIETVLADVPRLDYSGGGCPALLLEPQRTNLVEYSEEFFSSGGTVTATKNLQGITGAANTGWTIARTGAIAYIQSGNGVADVFTPQDATGLVLNYYVKWISGTATVRIAPNSSVAWSSSVWNVILVLSSTGVVVNTQSNCSVSVIESLSNGWHRIQIAVNTATGNGATDRPLISCNDGDTFGLASADWVKGSLSSTSHIFTSGSTVTRGSDVCSKTGISSLIGQTEGVLYAEVDINVKREAGTPVAGIITLNVNAANLHNCILFGINRDTTNQIYALGQVANVTQFSVSSGNISSGIHKVALAYKANDFALFVDGVLVDSSNSGSVPPTSQVLLSPRFNGDIVSLNDRLKYAIIYTQRLSNAQLAAMTTL